MGIVLGKVAPMRTNLVVLGVSATLLLGACGDESGVGDTNAGAADVVEVAAAFYPLEYAVAEVGGEHVDVTNITPAGGESHDLEITARDAAALREVDLVVYLDGFAPALDDAVAGLAADQVLDVAAVIALDEEHADEERTDEEHTDEERTDDEPDDDGHGHETGDPHFWLDPIRYAELAEAVAARLSEIAPDHADDFAADASALRTELEALDAEFAAGLAACASTDLVTSHTAFNYLAERYGLHQVGITGLSPSAEPAPGKLAEVTDFVEEHGVTTVFYETLVDPAVAETLAAEAGARTAVLDPLEGLTDASAGHDYFEVMRSNLASLRAGLRCT
jgi:zinc transport system substrate-binding protein